MLNVFEIMAFVPDYSIRLYYDDKDHFKKVDEPGYQKFIQPKKFLNALFVEAVKKEGVNLIKSRLYWVHYWFAKVVRVIAVHKIV